MSFISTAINFILHLDKYLNVIIAAYGPWTYALLFLVLFCETGLVIIPFLPGDSLLFVTGVVAAQGSLNVWIVLGLLIVAAILGDTVNYWLGHHASAFLQKYIRKDHLVMTQKFYEKHGGKTIVLARFIPIVRTLAPFVAGMGSMNYTRFIFYNIVGGISWVVLFVLGGYFFGSIPIVKENMTIAVFVIIILSIIPAVIEYVRHRKTDDTHHVETSVTDEMNNTK